MAVRGVGMPEAHLVIPLAIVLLHCPNVSSILTGLFYLWLFSCNLIKHSRQKWTLNYFSLLNSKQKSSNFLLVNCFLFFVIKIVGISNLLKILFLQKVIFLSKVIFGVALASAYLVKWSIAMITYLFLYSTFRNRPRILIPHWKKYCKLLITAIFQQECERWHPASIIL